MSLKSHFSQARRQISLPDYFFGFLIGLLVAIIGGFFLFNINLKTRYANGLEHLKVALLGNQLYQKESPITLAVIPSNTVLQELSEKGAVFDNTRDLTNHGVGVHSSFAVKKDPLTGYVLAPDIKIHAYFLKTSIQRNIDPPLLYLNGHLDYSDDVKKYLKEETVLAYQMTSDENGNRTTLPKVSAKKKVLIVGDSVAFGLGVDDQNTLASQLQIMLGNSYQVVNAGVSGYGTKEILATIEKHRNQQYAHLIYVACSNDFRNYNDSYVRNLQELIENLQLYRSSFDKISLSLNLYIYEAIPHYFNPEKANAFERRMEKLNSRFLKPEDSHDFQFFNWYTIANQYQTKGKSLLSAFSLYADHVHLSKQGNYEFAKAIYQRIFQ
ncbi:SGNH/GDSL hydrolase family protein [Candidatus Omnitrophota bacterium]